MLSNLALVHSSTAVEPATSAGILAVAAGQINVFDESNTAVTSAPSVPVRFVQGVDLGELQRVTPLIRPKSIVSLTKRAAQAGSAQQVSIGFGASGGSIPVVNGGEYGVKFIDLTQGYEPFPRVASWYKADVNATEFEIALNWYRNLITNPSFTSSYTISLAVKVASVAIGDSATLSVTNGSKMVVASSASHAVTAGQFLRIGHATTDTFPVYEVESVSGTIIMLKNEFQGATATGVVAGVVSTITNQNAGILVFAKPSVTSFQVATDSDAYGSTVRFVAGTSPSGTTTQVRALEQLMASYSGQVQKTVLPQTYKSYVPDNTTYILYNMRVKVETRTGNVVSGTVSSDTYNITLAVRTGRNVSALDSILNGLRADGVPSIS